MDNIFLAFQLQHAGLKDMSYSRLKGSQHVNERLYITTYFKINRYYSTVTAHSTNAVVRG